MRDAQGMNRWALTIVIVVLLLLLAAESPAQFSSDYETTIVESVVVSWPGDYYVGSDYIFDTLLVRSGGVLSNSGSGCIGYMPGADFNAAWVTGSNSVWNNSNDLYVGLFGSGNSLVISNKGKAFSQWGQIGYDSTNNSAVVTGTGSVWSNSADLFVGNGGADNSLTVSNSGKVFCQWAEIGSASGGDHNQALVTGTNSVWNNSYGLLVGNNGSGNSLTISSAGTVNDQSGSIGFGSGDNNWVLVTGLGSVWSNQYDLYVGTAGSGNSLTISNAGKVLSLWGEIGSISGISDNRTLVTGPGSVWSNEYDLVVGNSGSGNSLVLSNGGTLAASGVTVGNLPSSLNNTLQVDGGALILDDASIGSLVIGQQGSGRLILNSGTVTVNSLLATNGAKSVVTFNGGTLQAVFSTVANGLNFAIGDGVHAAAFDMQGGTHSFSKGLTIRPNSSLTGCGTVVGNATNFGMIVLDCFSTFSNQVVNSATMIISGGAIVDFYGPVVNNGTINAIHGTAVFHSGLSGNGVYLDAEGDYDGDGLSNLKEDLAGTDPLNSTSVFGVTSVVREGTNIRITWKAVGGKSYAVQTNSTPTNAGFADSTGSIYVPGMSESTTNYLDAGAATNQPGRFYRVRLVP